MSATSSLIAAAPTAPHRAAAAPVPASTSVIDTASPHRREPVALALARMARTSGKQPLAIVREFTSLAFGPGRLSWTDYANLRLFDDNLYGAADKRQFVGQAKNRTVASKINYRIDWYGLTNNKIAALSYLAAYGFPTTPIRAIFAPGLTCSKAVLRSAEALHRFLLHEAEYPLFGKPLDSARSLGSIAIEGVRPAAETLIRRDGREIAIGDFIAEIERHYPEGYLFQPFEKPHPAVAAVCGDRLATLRIVTLPDEFGPAVFRACWKIPAGGNFADNYWRAGNLLGTIDQESGRLSRVTRGAGFDLAAATSHPDTGACLIGREVPDFARAAALAIEAARLMRQAPLIGWDIAVTERGPVIVEMNANPDFILNQIADRRGALDAQTLDCIARQKRDRRAFMRKRKALLRQ